MINVFQLILREQYPHLPEVVRRFHETRLGEFTGKATIKGGKGLMVRALRKIGGFPAPAEGEVALKIRVIRSEVQERVQRQFGEVQFSSVFTRINRQNLLSEDFGMFRFYFSLRALRNGIEWQFERWDFAGIPMPELLSPDAEITETVGEDGKYTFAVLVKFPIIGILMDYAGSLE